MSLDLNLHRRFVESLRSLTSHEQHAVESLVSRLRSDNVLPGMRPHQVGGFLSYSPNMDLRIIAVADGARTTLVHVGHHDDAYAWARRTRVLETGADSTELVDVSSILTLPVAPDTEFLLPLPVQELLAVPDADSFMLAISDLSPEWQEWILDAYLAGGDANPPPAGSSLVYCPESDAALEQALNLRLPDWRLFLHPTQREAATDLQHATIAITGGPGTGKTIVLLNRILLTSPKGKDDECDVLVTHSLPLADHLYQSLRNSTGRHFYVVPSFFLCGSPPPMAQSVKAFKAFGLEVSDGQLFVKYKGSDDRRRVRELLIDEFQDATPELADLVSSFVSSNQIRVTLALDIDQSIFSVGRTATEAIVESCDTRYDLSYSYRATRQILEVASKWLVACGVTTLRPTATALSGPAVRFVSCRDVAEQVEKTVLAIHNLNDRYESRDVAIVYCQYYAPHFKGQSDDEKRLRRHPEVNARLRFASTTKGREYFAGVVFVSRTFMALDKGTDQNRLRINTLFVALTRFRDEVTVIYTEDCVIEARLASLRRDLA